MTEADLHAIADIEATSFTRPLTRDDLVALHAKPAFRGFVLAPDGGMPASYALFLKAGGMVDLVSTGTAAGARRRGFASRLLGESLRRLAADKVTEVTLEVAVDNVAALALYAGLGFGEVGRRSNYYRRPRGRVDALVLRWRPSHWCPVPQGSA
jgi:ribosomal-protein-alanine N-acetyltransferase